MSEANAVSIDRLLVRLSEGVTIMRGDCSDLMPLEADALVSDPPYGIGYAHGGHDTSGAGDNGIGKGKYVTKFKGAAIHGDDEAFNPAPWLDYPVCVLWGANHYASRLPDSHCWLVWDKRAASGHTNDFADCELAWCSRSAVARMFRHHWDGMMKASERGVPRLHPTQKPVALMAWCMEAAKIPEGATVLDPYMGSGTTGVACIRTGRRFIGIERDAGYFAAAKQRLEDELRQGLLPFTDNCE